LANALRHPPEVGYDGLSHLAYAAILAQGRLPTPVESHESFSPPLAYVAPALAHAAGLSLQASGKVAQLANVALSLALCLALLRLCDLLRPGDAALKLCALGLLGSPGLLQDAEPAGAR
jgi:hypothetical protein